MIVSAVSGFSSPLTFLFIAIAAIVLIAAWAILAGSRFIQGGIVERPERVPQLYGYTVCLIAVIMAVTSFLSLVQNTLTLSAPELDTETEFSWEPSVSSFEAFRATYDRARQFGSDRTEAQPDSIPEPELRADTRHSGPIASSARGSRRVARSSRVRCHS